MPVRTEVPWNDTVPEQPASAAAAATGPEAPQGAAQDPFIGRVIDDRYRIIERLGEGGMGAVYVAEHLKLRKQVAVKTILAEFASNPQLEARFAREALATAQLDHPHVASALDFGHFPEGGAYLVIQLVRGITLGRHLDAKGRLPWGLAAELGAQIADALAAAHAAGVIHRDLKPDNILLEPRDDGSFHAKVVDFGIARVSGESDGPSRGPALTRIGAILGTPGYMAPEQAVGQPVDARGDLYALGVILWECCVGRRLWQGESLNELVACQLRSTPTTLQQELGSRIPEALSALVAQLLGSSPGKRPDAAATVRDALRRLAQTSGPAPVAGQGPARGLPEALVPAPAPWSLPALRRRLTSPRGLAAVAGLTLLVVLALLGRCAGAPTTAAPTTAASDTPVTTPAPATPSTPPAVAQAPIAPPPAAEPAPVPQPVPAAVPTPEPAVADPGLPPELADTVTSLLGTGSAAAKGRKRAVQRVLAHRPEDAVPLYLRHVAALEKASSCAGKRGVLEKMDTAADPRVLPALRRLSGTRRRGCGFFNSQDCFECLREPLARLIGRLEASG